MTREPRTARQPLPPGTQWDRPAGKASLPEGQQHKEQTKPAPLPPHRPGNRRHPSLATWAPGSEGTARTRSAGADREQVSPDSPALFRGRWKAFSGEQQRQQEDGMEGTPGSCPGTPQLLSLERGTATGPRVPGAGSLMTTHRSWQWQTSDESPQPGGRNWGGPSWRDSQE